MSDNDRARRPFSALLASSLVLACAQPIDYDGQTGSAGGQASAGRTAGAAGASAAGAGVSGSAAGGMAGAAASAGSGGTGLTSDLFGDGGLSAGGGTSAACQYPNPPDCDFARVDGCCKPLACERASGSDVFNTYPVESCRALLECVRADPGCSNAADPLCFGNEDPNAPCLMQGYQASHTDPEGPFAWTVELMNCVCGY